MAKNATPTPALNAMTAPQFAATLAMIEGRGRPPVSFLEELVAWGKIAPAEIFAPNHVANDAYTVIKSRLGTQQGNDASGTPLYVWEGLLHRRAAMLELMRVHAGRESSWKWNEGDDKSARPNRPAKQLETGIFQVSSDSEGLDSEEGVNIMEQFAKARGIDTPEKFIPAMKAGHPLAMEYYARLVRVSIAWAGPLIRHNADSVYPYLNRGSMREFMGLLK